MFCGGLWCFVVFCGGLWCFVVLCGVVCGVLWCFVVVCGVLWCFVVFSVTLMWLSIGTRKSHIHLEPFFCVHLKFYF